MVKKKNSKKEGSKTRGVAGAGDLEGRLPTVVKKTTLNAASDTIKKSPKGE